jgi:hypothetical protein
MIFVQSMIVDLAMIFVQSMIVARSCYSFPGWIRDGFKRL